MKEKYLGENWLLDTAEEIKLYQKEAFQYFYSQ